ncbi:bifunctional adenosylcobinamide kinase/adenosylcobinamide-phosphate guanylyltransferase [Aestuariimicrobium soli]|uniref:bifunctional adenosylcobinamide kinase/adenosylcobinamide-phosphate guanylyltransferase n=1 Tax=Aestuariimicrobium soli TaxID=2035834 RepID=UPI003EB846C3
MTDSVPTTTGTTTLVTGGTRSGKSAVAEGLLDPHSPVTYVACGPTSDDADWNDRVRRHRERRPAAWTTLETPDLVSAIDALTTPALIDCLGTWLTAQLDGLDAWQRSSESLEPDLRDRITELERAIARCPHPLVVVTNEVGQSLISMERSGRLFTDWLGWTNQAVARVSDRVVLVVAGCALTIKD